MRRSAVLIAAVLSLALAGAASASGPWLGVSNSDAGVAAPGAAIRYVATLDGGSTTVAARRASDGRTLRTTTLAGRWGLPLVTANGEVGGLGGNGRVLVLAQGYTGQGALQTTSSFAVMGTSPLALSRMITLRGDFGFDTVSADGRTLYLIEHVSQQRVLDYRVRAYDLRAGRLLARVVADKRQRGWVMSGMPVARAEGAGGRWVYTLYANGDNYPFVHALDTTGRTAVCVGLPWDWTTGANEIANATLTVGRGRLTIEGAAGTRFALDTRTLRLTKL